MKTFALLFATAFVSAKDLPSMDMIPAMDDGPEIVYPSEEEIWQSTKDFYFYRRLGSRRSPFFNLFYFAVLAWLGNVSLVQLSTVFRIW